MSRSAWDCALAVKSRLSASSLSGLNSVRTLKALRASAGLGGRRSSLFVSQGC
jgi:hypothetical protein